MLFVQGENMIQIPVDKIIQALSLVSLICEMRVIIRSTKHVYICASVCTVIGPLMGDVENA